MDNVFENIYQSLTLEKMPGIVSFEKITGKTLQELQAAANDIQFESAPGELDFEESFGGGSLDIAPSLPGATMEDHMALAMESLGIS